MTTSGQDAAFPVIHVDLAHAMGTGLPCPPAALYFWCRGRPVGHVWLEDGHPYRNLADLAARCIDVAVLAQAHRAPADLAVTTSVVICTRDRPAEIRRCLAALVRQNRPPDQILVVDNAPPDDAVRAIAAEAGVDYVREDQPGLDFARNAGARAATGEIVLYTDDDVELHTDWLARMVAGFDAPNIGCVTGLVLPAELETEAQRFFERFWSFGRGYRRIDFAAAFYAADRTRGCPAWEVGAGASMAFRRAVFDDVGYFDERLDVGAAGCSGDSEYWHRLLGAGWTCRYEPSAVAFHYHRRDMAGLARQIRAYMRGHAAALLLQFERTGHVGNLRRAVLDLPLYYASRIVSRIAHGPAERDRLLRLEVTGYLSGLLFYLRTRRCCMCGRPLGCKGCAAGSDKRCDGGHVSGRT